MLLKQFTPCREPDNAIESGDVALGLISEQLSVLRAIVSVNFEIEMWL